MAYQFITLPNLSEKHLEEMNQINDMIRKTRDMEVKAGRMKRRWIKTIKDAGLKVPNSVR